ncbi:MULTISPECIES: methyltransferase domain-containing protein [Aequorivita]|uniref:Methyltransferase domain-containing protein n=1 Tax=Aequorivita iocasae TaxID=2803865 RepID=A0ABX7DQ97_9FLAO|nr:MULTISPECIES: methyltransferase domain-containing protein [Aequorivita]PHR13205.1 MAG: SAM-dependent methyltransferase [Aequorivita sp.]QQX75766.1 methyltransferase domain-containing protein [Aequorivita iocasae]UCA55226.1 TPMT family class I SAM-dependent methyltransferase [Aequorivita sp. F7]
MNFYETFWNHKYLSGETGWDIGYVSTPIKEYINQLSDKNLKILIPGGGNSYEAEYLFKKGFKNVFVVDISSIPLMNLAKRVPSFPKENLLHADFFELEDSFDLILEQTFFCALAPSLREAYANKMHQLLKPEGRLVGLLFNIPLNDDKPPFGGNKVEYKKLFSKKFKIEKMEIAYNSVAPRAGNELFFRLKRR